MCGSGTGLVVVAVRVERGRTGAGTDSVVVVMCGSGTDLGVVAVRGGFLKVLRLRGRRFLVFEREVQGAEHVLGRAKTLLLSSTM